MNKQPSQSISIDFENGKYTNHLSVKEFEIKEVGGCSVLYIYKSDNCVFMCPMNNIREIKAQKFPLKIFKDAKN